MGVHTRVHPSSMSRWVSGNPILTVGNSREVFRIRWLESGARGALKGKGRKMLG